MDYFQGDEVYEEPMAETAATPTYEVYAEPVPKTDAMPAYEVAHNSRIQLRTRFNDRNYLRDGDPKAPILRHFEPKSNSTVDQNFAPVLLAHARLYRFAQIRLIAPMKTLTFDKLHKMLMDFKLYTKRIGDILELARYAYSQNLMKSSTSTSSNLAHRVSDSAIPLLISLSSC